MDVLDDVFAAIASGRNVLIHAPGGTGKTHLLKVAAFRCLRDNKKVACTAPTGVAALGLSERQGPLTISGSTIHSWAGVGQAEFAAEKLVEKVLKFPQSRAKWIHTDVLCIDEISMTGGGFLDKLDYVGRRVRRINKPFGGLQLVLGGDFLQLPPVKEIWAFRSNVWAEMDLVPFTLDTPQRYPDVKWFELLLRVRKAQHTEEDVAFLQTRVEAYKKWRQEMEGVDDVTVVKPSVLHSRRADVALDNDVELKRLTGEEIVYRALDVFEAFGSKSKKDYYFDKLEDSIPKVITLKVGAQVMLKANLDVAAGYVNGSRGVITEVHVDRVAVKWVSGLTTEVTHFPWVLEDADAKATRSQIPLILAWSITVHKSQGATLDYAICNLGPTVFLPGQAYVALSRVRSSDGLLLEEFYPNVIKADPDALEFVNSLETQATQPIPPPRKQKRFLTANTAPAPPSRAPTYSPSRSPVGPVASSVRTVVKTHEPTKRDEGRKISVPTPINFITSRGKVKVGRIVYSEGKPHHPSAEGYTPIVVLTKSSPYGELGPYVLRDREGRIMENLWQFRKVYPWVPETRQIYSRWDPTVIWEHPREEHVVTVTDPTTGEQTDHYSDEFWAWREKGLVAEHAVRYPVGSGNHRKTCKYVLTDEGEKLSLVESRKKVYLRTYVDLAAVQPKFKLLRDRLERGENLLIIEVDGPHQESLEHYKTKYRVGDDFIVDHTVDVSIRNMSIMLRDPKHSFGHGYCLASALLGIDKSY